MPVMLCVHNALEDEPTRKGKQSERRAAGEHCDKDANRIGLICCPCEEAKTDGESGDRDDEEDEGRLFDPDGDEPRNAVSR